MVNRQNIQVLLDEITLVNVQTYLTRSGWEIAQLDEQEICVFTKSTGEEEMRLWSWNSSGHPKFRSRVQNLIFSLAVQQSCEPIDIANDIYDSSPESLPSESGAPPADHQTGPFQLVLSNTSKELFKLGHPNSWHEAIDVSPQQPVTIFFDYPNGRTTMDYGKNSLDIRSDKPASVRVFDGAAPQTPSFKLINMPDWSEFGFQENQADAEAACRSAWQRAEFELEGIAKQTGFEKTVLKSMAVLLVSCAKQLPDCSAESAGYMWKLCKSVLNEYSIQLELYPACEMDLLQTAQADDNFAPTNTLDWLRIHAVYIGG